MRYGVLIPGWGDEAYVGEWKSYANQAQILMAQELACLDFIQTWGMEFARLSYLPSDGYAGHGYRVTDVKNGGCAFTLFATHPIYGTPQAHRGGGPEFVQGQCLPLPLDESKVAGQQCQTQAGNPINLATGNKYQLETDYRSADGILEFTRHYNSRPASPLATHVSALGPNWRSTFDRAIRVGPTANLVVYVFRPDGKVFTFSGSNNGFITDPDVSDRLARRFDAANVFVGWRYTVAATDDIETYDADGRLLAITTRAGIVTTLAYDSTGKLSSATDSFGKQLSFGYDSLDRLSSLTTPNGDSFVYEYDSASNLSQVAQPGGAARGYLYNEPAHTGGASLPGALTGIVDENGIRFATFRYNSARQAISSEHAGGVERYTIQSLASPTGGTTTFVDPLGKSRTINLSTIHGTPRVTSASERSQLACAQYKSAQFDDNGNVVSAIDFNNVTTSRSVDPSRNVEVFRIEAADTPRSRKVATTWHPVFRLPVQIYGYRRSTTFTHDTNGNVLTRSINDIEHFQPSRVWTYTYNAFGKVLTEDGPRSDVSDVTTYAYYGCNTGYECGQVHTITNASGHVTTYHSYDAHGQPLTISDANGVMTTLTYDSRQRLKSRTIGSETTSYEYWPTGLLKKVTLLDGSYALYGYDDAHRLTQIADASGNRIVYELDAMGNRLTETVYDASNAPSRVHRQVFDQLNRLWKDIGAANTPAVTTTFGYDDNGNQTGIDGPLGRDTTQAYDELNRITRVTDPLLGETTYGYDALDQLISVKDPRNLVTSYGYNAWGDLTVQVSPDTGSTINSYDASSNLRASTDARNIVTTYSYDELNRVVTAETPDQTITYTYDAGPHGRGRLTGVLDSEHSLSWSYDAQGRMITATQVVGSVSKTTAYTYLNGLRQSMTTPSGQVITYAYTDGKVTSISVNGATLISDVLYEPFGPVRQWTWGNGSLSVRTIDQDGKITQIDSAGLKTYSYDDAFRITGITDSSDASLSWTYGYDDLDRLMSASKAGTTLGYTYDANGNRLTQTGSGAATFTIAPNSNRLTSTSGALTRTYDYDNAGNAASYDGITFTYNNRGRMKSSTKNGVTTDYTYNALGQLVKKGTSALYYYDDAGHILGIYSSGGVLSEEIVWLGDIPLATLRSKAGGGVDLFYIHSDHLNTPRVITDASGNARWKWDAEPFGGGAVNDNPSGAGAFAFNLRFPGQMQLAETGLHYNYYRDYDPATGRYTQSDPIGLEGGLNTYAYVKSNPVSLVDPEGLDSRAEPRSCPTCWPFLPPTTRPPGGWIEEEWAKDVWDGAKNIAGAIKDFCTDQFCVDRYLREEARCERWRHRGPKAEPNRWYRACLARAAHRRNLCYGNGGKADPNEPPEWSPNDLE